MHIIIIQIIQIGIFYTDRQFIEENENVLRVSLRGYPHRYDIGSCWPQYNDTLRFKMTCGWLLKFDI